MEKWTLFLETYVRGGRGDSYHHCDASKQLDVSNETKASSDTLSLGREYESQKSRPRRAERRTCEGSEGSFAESALRVYVISTCCPTRAVYQSSHKYGGSIVVCNRRCIIATTESRMSANAKVM